MKKILLVEDENFIADIYARQLQQGGYNVKIVGDAPDAIKALEETSFDLMLLDILLPSMNGLELLKLWKDKNPNSLMAVLLLTNVEQDEYTSEANKLGAQGYLVKSDFTPQKVLDEVNKALDIKTTQN